MRDNNNDLGSADSEGRSVLAVAVVSTNMDFNVKANVC